MEYAKRALKIAEDAVAKTSDFLGVTETDPIDFFVYSDGDDFRDRPRSGYQGVRGRSSHP